LRAPSIARTKAALAYPARVEGEAREAQKGGEGDAEDIENEPEKGSEEREWEREDGHKWPDDESRQRGCMLLVMARLGREQGRASGHVHRAWVVAAQSHRSQSRVSSAPPEVLASMSKLAEVLDHARISSRPRAVGAVNSV